MNRAFTVAFPAWLGFAWLPGLVALQSIPHSGAWRTLLLLAGLVHLAVLARRATLSGRPWGRGGWRSGWLGAWRGGGPESWLLLCLTGWLVLQSALLAPTPAAALAALAEEWSKLVLMTALGVLLASHARGAGLPAGVLVAWLLLGHFIHVLSALGFQAWQLLRQGALLPGESLLGNYGYVSPFVAGALALLLAEALGRLCARRCLRLSGPALATAILAALLAQAVLNAKAGIIMGAFLFTVAAALAATLPGRRRWAGIFLAGAVLSVVSSLAISNRWQGGERAVVAAIGAAAPSAESPVPAAAPTAPATPAATATPATAAPPAPIVVPAGVDESFYLRAASARIGVEGILRHPLGIGYGADAFGRYLVERGGAAGAVSSESGWIDFALANGIPGLLLLLLLFGALLRRGWTAFRAGSPVGLALAFVVLNYAGRGLLDGHLSGSRLSGFALVAAVLWTLTLAETRNDAHRPA